MNVSFGDAAACRLTAAVPSGATGSESATSSRRHALALGCTQVRAEPSPSLTFNIVRCKVRSTACCRYLFRHALSIACPAAHASLPFRHRERLLVAYACSSADVPYPVYSANLLHRAVLVAPFWCCSLPPQSSHPQHTLQKQAASHRVPPPPRIFSVWRLVGAGSSCAELSTRGAVALSLSLSTLVVVLLILACGRSRCASRGERKNVVSTFIRYHCVSAPGRRVVLSASSERAVPGPRLTANAMVVMSDDCARRSAENNPLPSEGASGGFRLEIALLSRSHCAASFVLPTLFSSLFVSKRSRTR